MTPTLYVSENNNKKANIENIAFQLIEYPRQILDLNALLA